MTDGDPVAETPAVLVIDTAEQTTIQGAIEHLTMAGYPVTVARTERSARLELASRRAEAVVLASLGDPARTLSLLRQLRAGEVQDADPGVKVVTVGADTNSQAVLHYRAGAHLALSSNATPELIAAAVDAVSGLTPADRSGSALLRVGSLVLDRGRYEARSGNETVTLSKRELDLLCCLAKTPGRLQSRVEISREVYGSDVMAYNSRAIDAQIMRARTKLGELGEAERLHTIRGLGFRLDR